MEKQEEKGGPNKNKSPKQSRGCKESTIGGMRTEEMSRGDSRRRSQAGNILETTFKTIVATSMGHQHQNFSHSGK